MGAPLGTPGPGYASSDEKAWVLFLHFGGAVLLVLAPLLALLLKGGQSPTVRAHAVAALNFHIPWNAVLILTAIIGVCSLGFLSFLPLLPWAVIAISSVIGGVRADEGLIYRYPPSLRLVS